jgi:hypothetical protein
MTVELVICRKLASFSLRDFKIVLALIIVSIQAELAVRFC